MFRNNYYMQLKREPLLKRDSDIDFVKGLCLLLMVFGHIPREGTLSKAIDSVLVGVYAFHMPVFIFLSGYLFAPRTGTLVEVGKILRRLFKPYCIFSPVLMALLLFASYVGIQTTGTITDCSLKELILRFFSGHSAGALWFLYALGIVQLLGVFAFVLYRRLQWNVLIVMTYVLASVVLLQKGRIVMPTWALTYFFLGVIVKLNCREVIGSFLPFPLVVFFYVCGGWNRENLILNHGFVLSLLPVLFSISKVKIGKYIWVWSGIKFLGKHTMVILVFHSVVSALLRPVCRHILLFEPSGILYEVMMLGWILIVCLSAEWVLVRMKLYKWLF